MKRLLLLRHGEAEPADVAASDFARALTAHGRSEALEAAHRLRRAQCMPELILASPALRARETALIAAARLDCVQALQFESSAYPGSPQALRGLIEAAPAEVETLLLVGHNPGLSVLARELDAHTTPASELPDLSTGELRRIELSGAGWSQIDADVIRVTRLR